PRFGACAARVTDKRTSSRMIALQRHIGHRPIRVYLPELGSIEVVSGIRTSDSDQLLARGLNITGLVRCARRNHGLAPGKPPGQPEAREGDGEPRFLKSRLHPTFPSVRRDLDTFDSSTSRPCQAGQFVQTRTW